MARLKTLEALEDLYGFPKERTRAKEIDALDIHVLRFLSLSPFCLIGSSDGAGNSDVSPKGDEPGFVKVYDERTILVPDRPGNRRLDTYKNVIRNSSIGMLFLIPGIGETLRINGDAEIRDDEDLRALCVVNGALPITVMMVHIQTIFLHCPKSVMRSKLWDKESQIERKALPTLTEMIGAHSGISSTDESEEQLMERFNRTLWKV